MAEQTDAYEWRGDGEGAEIVLYAPDNSAFGRILPATRLPGVQSPVYAAASAEGSGWAVASATHAAPDLISSPVRGLFLVADAPRSSTFPEATMSLFVRNVEEASLHLPALNEAGVRRVCEEGAYATAEDGFIEEEDLSFLEPVAGDADALGRRSISAGTREWEGSVAFDVSVVAEILDGDKAEVLGLRPGMLGVLVRVGVGDLGRRALAAHRERIVGRIRGGVDFAAENDLPAAPTETEEAADLLAAAGAASNFADGRSARALYVLRRVLADDAEALRICASWRIGGFEEKDGSLVHRRGLARAGGGEALVVGDSVAVGTGAMLGSAPPFGVPEEEGEWPWEETGLLERIAILEQFESG